MRDQVNPVGAACILLSNQHIDMCTSVIRCDRCNVATKVIDAGEPVVRCLRAGRRITELGRNSAVDNDPAYSAASVEIPAQATISGAVKVIGYVMYSGCGSRGAESENAIDIAEAVCGDARPRIDRVRPRTIGDRVVCGKCRTVIVGDGHAYSGIGMEIVVGDKDLP